MFEDEGPHDVQIGEGSMIDQASWAFPHGLSLTLLFAYPFNFGDQFLCGK